MKTKKVKLNIELVLNLQSTVNKIYIWRFRSIHLLIGKTLKSRIYSKFVRFIHSFQSCMNAEEQNMNLRALRSETKSVCEQYFRCLKQKKKKKKKTKYEANKSIGLWGGRKLKLDYTLPSVCLLCHKEERGCCCRYSVVPSSPKTVNRTAMIIMSYWFTISHEHTMYEYGSIWAFCQHGKYCRSYSNCAASNMCYLDSQLTTNCVRMINKDRQTNALMTSNNIARDFIC